jgi:hypothetical protein
MTNLLMMYDIQSGIIIQDVLHPTCVKSTLFNKDFGGSLWGEDMVFTRGGEAWVFLAEEDYEDLRGSRGDREWVVQGAHFKKGGG